MSEEGAPAPGTGDPGMPRWVKVFLIIGVILVLAFLISMFAGFRHGPGLHTPSDDPGGHTPPVEHGP